MIIPPPIVSAACATVPSGPGRRTSSTALNPRHTNIGITTLASRAPQPDGSSPVVIYIYVEDLDTVIERAVVAGARVLMPVKNQFWGDRTGRIIDPSGHVWTISTRVEETSSAERQERWSSIVKG